MNNKLSILQAYRTMVHFFDVLYFSTYDDDLGGYMGGASIYSADQGQCPQTMDAAYWEDWMDAVKIVVQDDSITYDSIELTIEQSYAAMYQYLVTYCDVGSGLTMRRLRDLTDPSIQQSKLMQFLSGLWNQSLGVILEQDPYKKDGMGFGEKTFLDTRESFLIMRVFLDGICQYNHDQGLIQLVLNSRLKDKNDYWNSVPDVIESKSWKIWQQAIDDILLQNPDTTLNLLIAYKAMPLFLMNYFDKNRSIFIDTIISKFKTENGPRPRDLLYWSSWTSATIKVNAQQKAWVNNLVSIKTQVSQIIALKIIKACLQEYKELLGVDFVENIFSDELAIQLIYQQVIDNRKKNNKTYLLLDDEITILETYYIMLNLLEKYDKQLSEFKIDTTEISIDIYLMLPWIRICEQVIHEKTDEITSL